MDFQKIGNGKMEDFLWKTGCMRISPGSGTQGLKSACELVTSTRLLGECLMGKVSNGCNTKSTWLALTGYFSSVRHCEVYYFLFDFN